MQRAALYVSFKRELEAAAPTDNFSRSGAAFFATQILTTIGYGAFSVTTTPSKVLLIVFSVPSIGLFGFALMHLTTVFTGSLDMLLSWKWLCVCCPHNIARMYDPGIEPGRPSKHTRRQRLIAQLVKLEKHCVRDGKPGMEKQDLRNRLLSLWGSTVASIELPAEVQRALEKAYASDGDCKTSQKGPALLQSMMEALHHGNSDWKHESVVAELEQFQNELDKAFDHVNHENGEALDLAEALDWVITLTEKQHDDAKQRHHIKRTISAATLCLVLMIVGPLGFYLLESSSDPPWSVVDAIYFCVITVTTVGLGDFTPTNSGSLAFWYFWIVLSLGTVASLLNSLVASMVSRAGMVESLVHAEMYKREVQLMNTLRDREGRMRKYVKTKFLHPSVPVFGKKGNFKPAKYLSNVRTRQVLRLGEWKRRANERLEKRKGTEVVFAATRLKHCAHSHSDIDGVANAAPVRPAPAANGANHNPVSAMDATGGTVAEAADVMVQANDMMSK